MKIELNTTANTRKEILSIIQKYQPVNQRIISSMLGISPRNVRLYVRQLKEEGNLIKGTDYGYIIAKNPSEFDVEKAEYLRSLKLLRTMERRYNDKKNKNLFEK